MHILDGGITAWEAKGFAVNRGAQRWDLERQVRLVAGSIVLSSILGSIAVPKLKWVAVGDRRRPGRRGADQHLRDGHGAVQAALQPRCHLRCPDNRVAARRFHSVRREGELIAMIALTIGLAVFVGIALGLLGGGGSILTVPLLAYVAGMDAKQAIATSLLVVGVTSAIGADLARTGRSRAVAHRPGLRRGRAWPGRMPAVCWPDSSRAPSC